MIGCFKVYSTGKYVIHSVVGNEIRFIGGGDAETAFGGLYVYALGNICKAGSGGNAIVHSGYFHPYLRAQKG